MPGRASVCGHLPKIIFIAFNLVFSVSGVAMLAVGIWLRVDPLLSDYFTKLSEMQVSLDHLYTASYSLVAAGAFVFLLGLCGCSGVTKDSLRLLAIYLLLMVIVVLAEFALATYLAVNKPDITKQFHASLEKAVSSVSDKNNASMNFLQAKLSCCGVYNFTDYYKTAWHQSAKKQGMYVPVSCCRYDDLTSLYPRPIDISGCMAEAANFTSPSLYLNPKGCYAEALAWLDHHSPVLIALCITIACIEMFGIIFGVCLCRQMSSYA